MEELHRMHKDVPFGWLLLLQELIARRRARAQAGWPQPAPGDLRRLAAKR